MQARKWQVIHSNTTPLGLPPGREPGPGTDVVWVLRVLYVCGALARRIFWVGLPLARTRARGDQPRAGTGHVPPAGVGSRPPPPEPERVTSPLSPAWTSQRGCPPQLIAPPEGRTECGAGPPHACSRPQPVRLRPVGPSRSPCHHQPIPRPRKVAM